MTMWAHAQPRINNQVVFQSRIVVVRLIDPDWFLVLGPLFLPPTIRRMATMDHPQWEISSGMRELIKVVS